PQRRHDDRDRAGRALRGLRSRSRGDDDEIRFASKAFGGERGEPIALALGGQVVDRDRLPVDVTQLAQALEERVESARLWRIERQEAESRHLLRLLRLGALKCKTEA